MVDVYEYIGRSIRKSNEVDADISQIGDELILPGGFNERVNVHVNGVKHTKAVFDKENSFILGDSSAGVLGFNPLQETAERELFIVYNGENTYYETLASDDFFDTGSSTAIISLDDSISLNSKSITYADTEFIYASKMDSTVYDTAAGLIYSVASNNSSLVITPIDSSGVLSTSTSMLIATNPKNVTFDDTYIITTESTSGYIQSNSKTSPYAAVDSMSLTGSDISKGLNNSFDYIHYGTEEGDLYSVSIDGAGSFATGSSTSVGLGDIISITNDDTYLYIGCGSGISTYTVDATGSYTQVSTYSNSNNNFMTVKNNYLYTSNNDTTLSVFSISNGVLTLADSLTTTIVNDVYVDDDNYIYLACGSDGIKIYTLKNDNLVYLSTDNTYSVYNVIGFDNVLYFTDSRDGSSSYAYGYSYNSSVTNSLLYSSEVFKSPTDVCTAVVMTMSTGDYNLDNSTISFRTSETGSWEEYTEGFGYTHYFQTLGSELQYKIESGSDNQYINLDASQTLYKIKYYTQQQKHIYEDTIEGYTFYDDSLGSNSTWNINDNKITIGSDTFNGSIYIKELTSGEVYNYATLEIGSSIGSYTTFISADNKTSWQVLPEDTKTSLTSSNDEGIYLRIDGEVTSVGGLISETLNVDDNIYTSTESSVGCFNITPTVNQTLTAIKKNNNVNALGVRVIDNTTYSTIGTASFVGDIATFSSPLNLTAGFWYRIEITTSTQYTFTSASSYVGTYFTIYPITRAFDGTGLRAIEELIISDDAEEYTVPTIQNKKKLGTFEYEITKPAIRLTLEK